MNDINSAIISGRLADMPRASATPSGTQVVEFTVAINKYGKNGEETSFVGVIAFGKLAGFCAQYLGKGAPVLVSGTLRQDKWQDRQTGQNRSVIRIVASDVRSLDTAPGQQTTPQAPQAQLSYARSEMTPAINAAPQQQTFQGSGFTAQNPTTDPEMPF